MNQIITKYVDYENKHPHAFPVIYQLVASLMFSLTSVMTKILNNVPANQTLFTRSVISMLLISPIVSCYNIDCYPKKQSILSKLIWRGVIGSIAALSWFQSIKLMPTSESVVLIRTTPIWTSLIAVFVLHTVQLQASMLWTLLFCISGVLMISKPPFIQELIGHSVDTKYYEYHSIGVALSLLSSIMSSIVQVLISSLSGGINQITILQYFSVCSIILPILCQLTISIEPLKVPDSQELLWLILIGITGCAAQLLMNRSFMQGSLTQMSLLGQSQVLFSLLFDTHIVILTGCLVQTVLDRKNKHQ